MRVFIVGVAGHIGRALAERLHGLGHAVSGSSHEKAKLGGLTGLLERSAEVRFDASPNPDLFAGCDAVVHCAYDVCPGASELNVSGTAAILRAAAEAGVDFQVFVSSHSARVDAPSEYGQAKYRCERLFLEQEEAVVRPGLVVASEGFFARNMLGVVRTPITPLLDRGGAHVVTVALSDLLDAMVQIIERRRRGAFNLFDPDPPTMAEFVRMMNRVAKHTAIYVPVPASWLLGLGSLVEPRCSPIRPALDRLRTMRLNAEQAIHYSHLGQFVVTPVPVEESIRRAWEGIQAGTATN